MTAEQFTSTFLEVLHGSGIPSFRRKYRGLDLLLIDDVQFLIGKKATAIELYHTLESLQRDGKQIVLTADRSPEELTVLGTELSSRLQGGMSCPVQAPDAQTRLELARRFSAKAKLATTEEVLQFLAEQFTKNARQISGAVHRLHAYARAHDKAVSLEDARGILEDLVDASTPSSCALPDIERAVCEVFGLEPTALQSSKRSRTVNPARMLAMWLSRKHTRSGLSEIGAYFGKRTHSTVISAHKTVEDWLTKGDNLSLGASQPQVGDVIRKVEDRLKIRRVG